MKDRTQDLFAGSAPGRQTSAGSRGRLPATPTRGLTMGNVPRRSGDVHTPVGASTDYTSLPLAAIRGRGAGAPQHFDRGRDRSPPLVTRSAAAQRPPGSILTKQTLVRLRPCSTSTATESFTTSTAVNTSNNISSTNITRSNSSSNTIGSNTGTTSSSTTSGSSTSTSTLSSINRASRFINLGKDSRSSSYRHNDGSISYHVPRRSPLDVANDCYAIEHTNFHHDTVAPVGWAEKANRATSSFEVSVLQKAPQHAGGPCAAVRAPPPSTATNVIVTQITTGTCACVARDTSSDIGKVQLRSADCLKLRTSADSKRLQGTKPAAGDVSALAVAVNVPYSRGKEQGLGSDAALTQNRLQPQQQQSPRAQQEQTECPRLLLQQSAVDGQSQHQQAAQQQAVTEKTCSSSKKEQADGSKARKAAAEKPKTKVTEEELLALVTEELKKQITWKRFFPGAHFTYAAGDGGVTSRNSVWYLNCDTSSAAEELIKLFHNKSFVDERHATYKAVAALAPYQKIARKKRTENKLDGQIEGDSLYISFLKSLKDGGTSDATRTAQVQVDPQESLRDDQGALITAMLLEMRERYNVKTTVNGRLYTLAMWRKSMSVLQEPSIEG